MKAATGACVLLTLLLHACTSGTQGTTQESNEVAIDSISGVVITELAQNGILNPWHIEESNDSIYLFDNDSPAAACFVADTAGRVIASGISVGNGPDEVLEITSVHRSGDGIAVYDSRKGRISRLVCHGSQLHLLDICTDVRLHDDAAVYSPSSGRTIICPVGADYSYALLDANGAVADSLAYYPPKPDKVSDFTHSLASTGQMAVIEGKAFARTVVYDGGVDFFTISNEGKLAHQKRYELFGMDYSQIEVQGMALPVPSENSRCGFMKPVASASKFYVPFSGDKIEENPFSQANEIYQFSADGNLERRLVLDRKVSGICVTADNSRLYGLWHDADTENDYIVSYNL